MAMAAPAEADAKATPPGTPELGAADGGLAKPRVRRAISVFEKYRGATADHINPFVNFSDNSTAEKIKLAIASVTIFPVRVVLILAVLLLILLAANIAVMGMSVKDAAKGPLRGWRWYVRWVAVALVRVLFFVMGFYYVKEKGTPSPVHVAPVCIANHMTFLDPLWFMYRFCGCFVAKKEAAETPVLGSLLKAAQCILVDRSNPNSRHDTAEELKFRAQSSGQSVLQPTKGPGQWHGMRCMLFPEGTTTNSRALISFKAGAFLCGTPLQPCVVRYPFAHADVSWVPDGPSVLNLVWRLNCQLINHMEVQYLPVYTPSQEELHNPQLFASNVRRVMAAALGVSTTEHSFDDMTLMDRAGELHLPPSRAAVELNVLSRLLPDVTNETVRSLLEAFAKIDTHKTGKLSHDQFCQALGLTDANSATPHSPQLRERLFELLDSDDDGLVDFREYLIALSALKGDREQAGRMAFALCDLDGDGVLSRAESVHALRSLAPELPAAQIDAIFAEADTHRAGTLTFDQWWATMQRHPEYLQLFRQRVVGSDLKAAEQSAAERKAKADKRAAAAAAKHAAKTQAAASHAKAS